MFLCYFVCCYVVFFFKQKTAYEMRISDWSSDVCSSDLFVEQSDGDDDDDDDDDDDGGSDPRDPAPQRPQVALCTSRKYCPPATETRHHKLCWMQMRRPARHHASAGFSLPVASYGRGFPS